MIIRSRLPLGGGPGPTLAVAMEFVAAAAAAFLALVAPLHASDVVDLEQAEQAISVNAEWIEQVFGVLGTYRLALLGSLAAYIDEQSDEQSGRLAMAWRCWRCSSWSPSRCEVPGDRGTLKILEGGSPSTARVAFEVI